jgi:hypothetical protein
MGGVSEDCHLKTWSKPGCGDGGRWRGPQGAAVRANRIAYDPRRARPIGPRPFAEASAE